MKILEVYLFDCTRVCYGLDLYRWSLPPSKLGWNGAFTPRHISSRKRLRRMTRHNQAFSGAVYEMKYVGV